jgi:mannose-6-phosphate isomerase-like protein (cupin superfamily)
MKGYIANIEQETLQNNNFRKVLFTGPNCQLVVMSLLPLQEIGEETHSVDQFIRVESGKGKAVLDGTEHEISDDFAVIVPSGTLHNIINTSPDASMKLYTVYSLSEHPDGIMDVTKEEAELREGH